MIPLEEALAIVDRTLAGSAPPPAEIVPARAAIGRVLAADEHARIDLPPFDKSAMDGYAVAEGDERDAYRLLETVAAGQTPSVRLAPGDTVKVMTGAPVPHGAGKVIMQELTEEAGGVVRVRRHEAGSNICRRGEDIRAGETVLAGGRRLDATDVGNLVSCGITDVQALRPLRMAILSTGDEIVDDAAELRPGRIMNANGPMLVALAAEHGLAVVSERSVGDDLDETTAALAEAVRAADIVVLSGGVSVGELDCVPEAMDRVPLAVRFTRIAVQPGRPTVFATLRRGSGRSCGTVVFGLPGNPVSVCVMFHLFVLRAAARLCGAEPPQRELRLAMAGAFRRRRTDRAQFVPARLTETGAVEALEYHGSAHLLSLREADGFLQVPVGVKKLAAGQVATFLPMRGGGL
jgi:molybdopterin molybdotransferase